MRLLLALIPLFGLAAPALAQSRAACEMASPEMIAAVLGPDYERSEEGDASAGVSLCKWKSDSAIIRLHSVTAASQGIVGGTPLEYFNQNAAYRKDQLAPYYSPLDGPWQAGYIIEVPENNPDEAISLSFINKDDTVSLETFHLDRETAVGLAAQIAESM